MSRRADAVALPGQLPRRTPSRNAADANARPPCVCSVRLVSAPVAVKWPRKSRAPPAWKPLSDGVERGRGERGLEVRVVCGSVVGAGPGAVRVGRLQLREGVEVSPFERREVGVGDGWGLEVDAHDPAARVVRHGVGHGFAVEDHGGGTPGDADDLDGCSVDGAEEVERAALVEVGADVEDVVVERGGADQVGPSDDQGLLAADVGHSVGVHLWRSARGSVSCGFFVGGEGEVYRGGECGGSRPG